MSEHSVSPSTGSSGDPDPHGGDPRLRDGGGDRSDQRTERHTLVDRTRARLLRALLGRERASIAIARSAELVREPDHILQEAAALRDELRAGVIAYAREMHDEGVPPEQMLVEIKTAMREILPVELDVTASRELMADAVRWSIDAYYAP